MLIIRCLFSVEIFKNVDKMTMSQTAMVLCVLGLTLLITLPDDTTASDKFFQTGGRFGKRHDDRISGIEIT